MKKVLHALVDKNTNRAIALLGDQATASWMRSHLPIFSVIPVVNTGSTSFRTKHGTINAVSLIPEEFDGPYFYMITDYPDGMTLVEAYDIIAEKK